MGLKSTLSVSLDTQIISAIEAKAEKSGASRSEVVNSILSEVLVKRRV